MAIRRAVSHPVWAGLGVALLFLTVLFPTIRYTALAWMPASFWLNPATVIVFDDIPTGTFPVDAQGREVRRPFQSAWVAVVSRVDDDGHLVEICRNDSVDFYDPGSPQYPADIDLAWWLEVENLQDHCGVLEPGQYVLQTTWRLHVPGEPEVTVVSRFEVLVDENNRQGLRWQRRGE